MTTRELLQSIKEDGFGSLTMDEENDHLWRSAGELALFQYFHYNKPAVIVELGTYQGVSSILMSHNIYKLYGDILKSGIYNSHNPENFSYKIYTIDIDPNGAVISKQLCDKYSIRNIIQLTGDAVTLAEDIATKEKVDMWYVDARHTYDHVISTLEIIHKTGHKGQVIFGHDYKFTNGDGVDVVKAFNVFLNKYRDIYSIPTVHYSVIGFMRLI